MKKLRNKVFFTIFSILTVFTLVVIVTAISKNYMEKKNSITGILLGSSKKLDVFDKNKTGEKVPNREIPNKDIKRIYLDFNVYTIILDDYGNYQETINHTNDDNFDETYIKNIASDIIATHNDKIYIGNLYLDKYSYTFTPDNTLIILDNTKLNDELLLELSTNILIFIICEFIIILVTYFLTKWIITPVKRTFEKQKVFVADASHELKTPLAVILASADAYFNDKDDKWVHNIKSESERMVKLVTELLDLAKTENEQKIYKEKKKLSDIIESSILTFEGLFYDNKIKLKYDIEKDVMMLCNEDLIVQLMGILIDNAITHSYLKGRVFVNLYKNNKQIILEVKNTGSPISNEDEEKIFERFYKADISRNRNTNNYGLGLAIAKNIVEMHDGNISAHSKDGYTTFKIVWNSKNN